MTEPSAVVLEGADWMTPGLGWNGVFDGERVGVPMSFSLYSTDAIGAFTQAHSHPNETITLMRDGVAEIKLPDRLVTLRAGDVLGMPPGLFHSLCNLGPGRIELLTFHLNPKFLRDEG